MDKSHIPEELLILDNYRDAYEYKALLRLRNKCFVSAAGLGVISGGLNTLLTTPEIAPLVFEGLLGCILLLVCGFVGGISGTTMRNLVLWLRTRQVDQGDLCLDGIVLGGFGGGFLGFVVKLMLWHPETAVYGVSLGTFIGSFLGALPGEQVTAIVRMLALEDYTPPAHLNAQLQEALEENDQQELFSGIDHSLREFQI